MTGESIKLGQLLLDPTGNPLAFACPLGRQIYSYRNIVAKFGRKLQTSFALIDNQDPRIWAEIVCTIISDTLSHTRKITVEGALTPLRHPPSIDYICEGRHVDRWWGDPLVTAVVRRITAAPDLGLPTEPDGTILQLITITPRSKTWKNVIDGAMVDAITETHLLKPGDRFDSSRHCVWQARQALGEDVSDGD